MHLAPTRFSRPWTRRALLGSGVAALAATGIASMFRSSPAADDTARRGVAGTDSVSAQGDWSGSYLQIVAHPDDDLYFMNPALQRCIAKGMPVVTVVLTASEADGKNTPTTTQDYDDFRSDKPGYTEARHNGLRSAYALMATGDQNASWRRDTVTLTGGALVELCTLAQRPAVQLYFFNIAQNLHGDNRTPDGTLVRLRALWTGDVPLESTLPGTGAPVVQPQDFSCDQVTACLVDLLKRHRPTVVRTLDPDPEHDPAESGISSADHIDHTATAQFAIAALHAYVAATGARPAVEYYRGYTSKFWPSNLSAQAKAEKRRYLMPYAGFGAAACPDNSCGDFQVRPDPAATTHIVSTAYRYTPTTDWLVRDGAGALHAFAVLGGQVAHWAERTPGGDAWGDVAYLAGEWMMPRVKVLTDRAGRIHLIAMRRSPATRTSVTVEVVRAFQHTPGSAFGPWESLGGPDYGNPDHEARRELGAPTAAFDSAGLLHVFARDFGQGLSHCQELKGGGWSPWKSLGGAALQDAVTAVTTGAGLIEIYAADAHSVLRWHQKTPGGGFDRAKISTPVPIAGAVTPVESRPGRITLYYREAGTANVMAFRQQTADGDWPPLPGGLGSHGGTGEVAAIRHHSDQGDADLVVHRGESGSLAVASTVHGQPGFLGWADTGGPLVNAPALAEDKAGRTVVAVLGVDARLHVSRQVDAGKDSGFGDWVTI